MSDTKILRKNIKNNINSGQRPRSSNMNEAADASSQLAWESIDDKDIAAAAIKLAISSSRKSFTDLCTKIALILKDNINLKKELNRLTEVVTFRLNSQPRGNNKAERCSVNVEQKSHGGRKLFKKLSAKTEKLDLNKSTKTNAVTVTADIHFEDKQLETCHQYEKCVDETIEGKTEAPTCDRFGKLTFSDTVNNNEVENSSLYWKNKYIQQYEIVKELEERLSELQSQKEIASDIKTADKSVECTIEIERESEVKYLDSDGWQSILKHSHHIPFLAPVVLFGCKCSRCEYMSNPIFYIKNKDVKMHEIVSNSKPLLQIDDLVMIPGNHVCRVAYVGHLDEPELLDVVFVGLVMKIPVGFTDGYHRSRRYFACEKNYGVFIPINWIEFIVKRSDKT